MFPSSPILKDPEMSEILTSVANTVVEEVFHGLTVINQTRFRTVDSIPLVREEDRGQKRECLL